MGIILMDDGHNPNRWWDLSCWVMATIPITGGHGQQHRGSSHHCSRWWDTPCQVMATNTGGSWSPPQPPSWWVMATILAGVGLIPVPTTPSRSQPPPRWVTGTTLAGHRCPPQAAGTVLRGCEHHCCAHPEPPRGVSWPQGAVPTRVGAPSPSLPTPHQRPPPGCCSHLPQGQGVSTPAGPTGSRGRDPPQIPPASPRCRAGEGPARGRGGP